MKKQLFSLPVEVTAVRFDNHGRSYPTRINHQGRSIMLEQSTNGEMISFCENGAYFWLSRRGKSWCVASPRTIL